MASANLDFSSTVLLIVDAQNDFFPGGALEVKSGDVIIKPLNNLIELFSARNGRIVATQDWHPENHASFASAHENKKPYDTLDLGEVKNQILWPKHCVQGSSGAEFHKDMDLRPVNFIIRKGFRKKLDSYSAFFENDRKTSTGLDGLLRCLAINNVVIGGLATDFCVLYSAFDSANLGYNTFVVSDAVCGIDFPAGSVLKALQILEKTRVTVLASGDIQ